MCGSSRSSPRLTTAFDRITIRGRSYPIRATVVQALESEGIRGEAGRIGTGAGIGAVIGGILGGFRGGLDSTRHAAQSSLGEKESVMSVVFRKILVPTDFSDTADTALHYAKALARQSGAELHLLHVCDDPMLLTGWPVLPSGPASEAGEEAAPLREQLKQLLTPEDRTQLKTGVHVIVGEPTGLAISRYAVEGEFELIVMGTHGRGALTHALMGSVAEKVVRSAPCPVLTIRHPTHRQMAIERLQEANAAH